MQIKPTKAPGDRRRKLRGLASELSRLRAEGYSTRGIHEAVVEAGLSVGLSTVVRELARLQQESPKAQNPPATPARPLPNAAAQLPATTSSGPVLPAADEQGMLITATKSHTRADVDEFFKKVNTNPLFNRKKKGPPL